MKPEWQEILDKVSRGEISAEEAALRMSQLESASADLPEADSEPIAVNEETVMEVEILPGMGQASADGAPAEAEGDAPNGEIFPPDGDTSRLTYWRNWWLIPFWSGLGVFILSAVLMAWGYRNDRFFWFYCAWLPLLVGLGVLVLSAWSRQARWLHLRIYEPVDDKGVRPHKVAISMPLPTRFAGWILRFLAPRIPQMREQNLESVGPLLESLGNTRDPLVVEVNEKNGQQVQIYIV